MTKREVGHRLKAVMVLLVLAMGAAVPAALAQTCVDDGACNPSSLNNIVFAFGMRCDGTTDDTTSFSSALTASQSTKNSEVVIPPGTCMIAGGKILIPDNIELRGAGKLSTTLKLRNAQNSYLLGLGGTNTGVTITDIALDGNKANQGATADLIAVAGSATVSNLTIQRCRFANAWSRAISLSQTSYRGVVPNNVAILDNDFSSNGMNDGTDKTAAFGDVIIPVVSNLRVERNFFSGTGGSAIQSGLNAAAANPRDWFIANNIFLNVLGFGVALGGGNDPNGGKGVSITGNTFDMPSSQENVIDLAFWTDGTITGNKIFNGVFNGVGDAPPSNRWTVTGNKITGTGSGTTQNGIVLGGNDLTITRNEISGQGNAGIAIVTTASGQAVHDIVIEGNLTENNAHPGVDLFQTSGSTIAAVRIKGNRSYGNSYGVGIATFGANSGYSNITIEGNDVRGNLSTGIRNNASGASGFSITNNAGWNDLTATDSNIGSLNRWGTGASVSNTSGSSTRVTTIITAGTAPGLAPTFVYSFPAAFPVAPICTSQMQGGTGTQSTPNSVSTVTTTAATVTYGGTPTAGTYLFIVDCRPAIP